MHQRPTYCSQPNTLQDDAVDATRYALIALAGLIGSCPAIALWLLAIQP